MKIPGKLIPVALILSTLTILSCGFQREVTFTGRTMGTTYQVKAVTGYLVAVDSLHRKIKARLEEINQSMSTYRPDSEISRFNNTAGVGERFAITEDFQRVMESAQKVFEMSGGAWDATVRPLVDLWGFYRKEALQKAPAKTAIQTARADVGFEHIDLRARGFLVKQKAGVTLDLAAIAKGYGVDAVSRLMKDHGIDNFLVEIGGEVYAAGRKSDGHFWRVGINRPDPAAPLNAIYRAFDLQDRAMATSGDYRNFFELDNVLYSHVIDPRTGYPVANGVVSVSVLAETCALADGLATAIMVMGRQPGIGMVEKIKGVECLVVVRDADGSFQDYFSSGFPH